jgi:hypothetical protein
MTVIEIKPHRWGWKAFESGWSWGCVSAVDCEGRTIWIADAHRGDGNRFVVRADEKLTALGEREAEISYAQASAEPVAACQARPYIKIRRCLTDRCAWFPV